MYNPNMEEISKEDAENLINICELLRQLNIPVPKINLSIHDETPMIFALGKTEPIEFVERQMRYYITKPEDK